MAESPSPPERPIVSPFDDEDADVIVISSDEKEFRLYKVILAKASHVFKDMFRLPQCSPAPNALVNPPEVIDGLPVIYLTEDCRTLQSLFSLCYPIEAPKLTSLDDVYHTLEAAMKYAMDDIVSIVRLAWPPVASQDPLRAFALACQRHWVEEARIAARFTLQEAIWPLEPPLSPDFKAVYADTIVRLISYHRRCGAAALHRVQESEWSALIFESASCSHCLGQTALGTAQALRLSDWYSKYKKRAETALLAQPAGCTVQESEFVASSIRAVYGAPPCEAPAHCLDKIKHVVQLFGDGIADVIAQVELDLDL